MSASSTILLSVKTSDAGFVPTNSETLLGNGQGTGDGQVVMIAGAAGGALFVIASSLLISYAAKKRRLNALKPSHRKESESKSGMSLVSSSKSAPTSVRLELSNIRKTDFNVNSQGDLLSPYA